MLSKLLTLSLVKRETGANTLSLHRLVQAHFRYLAAPAELQEVFELATTLLIIAFPRPKGQLYDRWAVCRLYLQHVLSLARIYDESQEADIPLQANADFCALLSYCSR